MKKIKILISFLAILILGQSIYAKDLELSPSITEKDLLISQTLYNKTLNKNIGEWYMGLGLAQIGSSLFKESETEAVNDGALLQGCTYFTQGLFSYYNFLKVRNDEVLNRTTLEDYKNITKEDLLFSIGLQQQGNRLNTAMTIYCIGLGYSLYEYTTNSKEATAENYKTAILYTGISGAIIQFSNIVMGPYENRAREFQIELEKNPKLDREKLANDKIGKVLFDEAMSKNSIATLLILSGLSNSKFLVAKGLWDIFIAKTPTQLILDELEGKQNKAQTTFINFNPNNILLGYQYKF